VVGAQHQVTSVGNDGTLALRVRAHSMKTTGREPWATWRITASVSTSQPWPAWLAGWPSSTVSVVLSSSTPFCAHFTRLPPGCGQAGRWCARSRCSSLKMLRSEGGSATPGATENASPSAGSRPW
jgi:hypothetical protein